MQMQMAGHAVDVEWGQLGLDEGAGIVMERFGHMHAVRLIQSSGTRFSRLATFCTSTISVSVRYGISEMRRMAHILPVSPR